MLGVFHHYDSRGGFPLSDSELPARPPAPATARSRHLHLYLTYWAGLVRAKAGRWTSAAYHVTGFSWAPPCAQEAAAASRPLPIWRRSPAELSEPVRYPTLTETCSQPDSGSPAAQSRLVSHSGLAFQDRPPPLQHTTGAGGLIAAMAHSPVAVQVPGMQVRARPAVLLCPVHCVYWHVSLCVCVVW